MRNKSPINQYSHANENIRRHSKPELSLQNLEAKKSQMKSKPEILKKYEYSFNFQENQEDDENEG